MIAASKAEFYAKIGPMNVHPRVSDGLIDGRYSESIWETPDRQKVGRSLSDTWAVEASRYWLSS